MPCVDRKDTTVKALRRNGFAVLQSYVQEKYPPLNLILFTISKPILFHEFYSKPLAFGCKHDRFFLPSPQISPCASNLSRTEKSYPFQQRIISLVRFSAKSYCSAFLPRSQVHQQKCQFLNLLWHMYNILTLGFETAKRWNYIAEIPNTKGPSEHCKRRKAWSAEYISKILDQIQEDPILHLSLHLAFVCSLRAGEIVAIDIHSINLDDGSMWISQILERVSDEALKNLSREKIAKVFPKQFSNAKSRLVLKIPKTEGSLRKQYLTQAHWFKKSKSMLLEVRLKKRKTLKPLA